ncbi:MAG: BrnT family toxin [Ignavibacteriales bacterium]|nr:BrnT family toxin [Ignavibacteriales bacterium]
MNTSSFEWDENKNKLNQKKHTISFEEAQYAFSDPNRIIARDLEHSGSEERFYCFGKIDESIVTVRFIYRNNKIRIIGAGFWRKGKEIYEKENKI